MLTCSKRSGLTRRPAVLYLIKAELSLRQYKPG